MLCRKSRAQMRKRSWHGRRQALRGPVFGKLKSILFRNRFVLYNTCKMAVCLPYVIFSPVPLESENMAAG